MQYRVHDLFTIINYGRKNVKISLFLGSFKMDDIHIFYSLCRCIFIVFVYIFMFLYVLTMDFKLKCRKVVLSPN